MRIATMAFLFVASTANAHIAPIENFQTKPILADLKDLRALNIPVLAKDEESEVGYAVITPQMQQKIQERAHKVGKCGGFEDLSSQVWLQSVDLNTILAPFAVMKARNDLYERAPFKAVALQQRADILTAMDEVKEEKLSIQDILRLCCENPSKIFSLHDAGSIQIGNFADFALIDLNASQTISAQQNFSKCGWTPFEGRKVQGKVEKTIVNGVIVYGA